MNYNFQCFLTNISSVKEENLSRLIDNENNNSYNLLEIPGSIRALCEEDCLNHFYLMGPAIRFVN